MKKIIIIIVLIATVVGGYIFVESQKAPETAADKSSDYKMLASDLISEFETDLEAANAKYNNKTIELSGIISEVEINGENLDVHFESDESMSTIRTQLISDMKNNSSIEVGKNAILKGIYNGYQDSELGIDIELNQGVIINE